jgi:predicted kinase
MTEQHATSQKAAPATLFPFCPTPPQWAPDWDAMTWTFSWLAAMHEVPQDPMYHEEGDVLIHTRMVTEAMTRHSTWQELPEQERTLLFASALLHDIGKPACTKIELDGRVSSRWHARRGEFMARRILWKGVELPAPLPFIEREFIAKLVRLHGLPLQFLNMNNPERAIYLASQSIRMDHLALLAEADVRGRICADQQELLERVELFRAFCQEHACYDKPRAFATAHSRFTYFHTEQSNPDYVAYDNTTFTVILMSGLPGAGKDTWIQRNRADWPVISLDTIRKELKISAEDNQGQVIQIARERARSYMRQKQSFIWNATNTTSMLRRQLVDFFVSYGAHVNIVYINAPYNVIIKRNNVRHARIPEHVIYKLLGKLEVPDVSEAHQVNWIVDSQTI